MTNFKYSDTVILVFAKAPVAGEVNTRLIPSIGVAAATQLQDDLIHSRLKNLLDERIAKVELWCSPNSDHVFFRQCQKKYQVDLFAQQGKDLGARMSMAIKNRLNEFKRVILIGTDAPSLMVDQIELAIQSLNETSDVVLVPAEDGGYVLIGMQRHCDAVFQFVPWGTDQVYSRTLEKLETNNLSTVELDSCWDIDRVEDYQRYRQMIL